MGLPRKQIDELASEIAALDEVDTVKLLSALLERGGAQVDWSVISSMGSRSGVTENPDLHAFINAGVHEVRRARRESE